MLQAVLEQTNHATFQALLQFATLSHQAASNSNNFVHRQRIIPTALTFAGGVNSADHAQTFPTLVKLLKEQVGFVPFTSKACIHSRVFMIVAGQAEGGVLQDACMQKKSMICCPVF